jgi:hypothetical protein
LDFLERGDELSGNFLVRFEALTTVKILVADLWVAIPRYRSKACIVSILE